MISIFRMMESQRMKLRTASNQDAKKIGEISREAFAKAFRTEENAEEVDYYVAGHDTEYFQKSIDSPACRFMVVTDEEQVFGFAQMIHKTPPAHEGQSWMKLERLYLDPNRIGTGAGKLMMKGCLKLASEEAIDYAWLEVLNTNERAVSFYERLGFETFDTCPGKLKGHNVYDLRMKKRIS